MLQVGKKTQLDRKFFQFVELKIQFLQVAEWRDVFWNLSNLVASQIQGNQCSEGEENRRTCSEKILSQMKFLKRRQRRHVRRKKGDKISRQVKFFQLMKQEQSPWQNGKTHSFHEQSRLLLHGLNRLNCKYDRSRVYFVVKDRLPRAHDSDEVSIATAPLLHTVLLPGEMELRNRLVPLGANSCQLQKFVFWAVLEQFQQDFARKIIHEWKVNLKHVQGIVGESFACFCSCLGIWHWMSPPVAIDLALQRWNTTSSSILSAFYNTQSILIPVLSICATWHTFSLIEATRVGFRNVCNWFFFGRSCMPCVLSTTKNDPDLLQQTIFKVAMTIWWSDGKNSSSM